jgi:hypothetical protein
MTGRRRWLSALAIAAIFMMFAVEVKAEEGEGAEVSFHGYLEANVVVRDEDGFQGVFMNHLRAVQQRNTMKFDVDVSPKIKWGNFGIEKIHMTYRGAYDSIFDLRHGQYDAIPENRGLTRFDYGMKDIRFENDLREAFIDFAYDGPFGAAFFRPGRQLVSWGETSGVTLLDVMCPKDNSYQMFFQNPGDLLTPLWMARLNYSVPRKPGFGLNFDLLWIPDIRPTQFAPMDKSMAAPYTTFLFQSLRPFDVKQDVPTEKQEYGVKMTADIGERFSVSLVYFRDVQNEGGMQRRNFAPAPTTIAFVHPMQDVYGGYFSYQYVPIDVIIRGEYSHYSGMPLSGINTFNHAGTANMTMDTFLIKPVDQYMLTVGKKMMVPWLSKSQCSFDFQYQHKDVANWENRMDAISTAKHQDLFMASAMATYFESRLNPVLLVWYNPETGGTGNGTWLLQPFVSWQFSEHLYTKVQWTAFVGNKNAKSGYASLISTAELAIRLGYEW